VLPEAKFGVLFPGFVGICGIVIGGAVLWRELVATKAGRHAMSRAARPLTVHVPGADSGRNQ
jgi:hypothetical protein